MPRVQLDADFRFFHWVTGPPQACTSNHGAIGCQRDDKLIVEAR
jgi:hypothetical protein